MLGAVAFSAERRPVADVEAQLDEHGKWLYMVRVQLSLVVAAASLARVAVSPPDGLRPRDLARSSVGDGDTPLPVPVSLSGWRRMAHAPQAFADVAVPFGGVRFSLTEAGQECLGFGRGRAAQRRPRHHLSSGSGLVAVPWQEAHRFAGKVPASSPCCAVSQENGATASALAHASSGRHASSLRDAGRADPGSHVARSRLAAVPVMAWVERHRLASDVAEVGPRSLSEWSRLAAAAFTKHLSLYGRSLTLASKRVM
jgi:hypothetical protein